MFMALLTYPISVTTNQISFWLNHCQPIKFHSDWITVSQSNFIQTESLSANQIWSWSVPENQISFCMLTNQILSWLNHCQQIKFHSDRIIVSQSNFILTESLSANQISFCMFTNQILSWLNHCEQIKFHSDWITVSKSKFILTESLSANQILSWLNH